MAKIGKKQMDLKAVTVGASSYIKGSDTTIANASNGYIDQATVKATINVKNGGLVIVFLMVTGFSQSNTGYSTYFTVGLDGLTSTALNGSIPFSSQGLNGLGQMCFPFIFKDVTPGDHTFYGLWNSNNSANTSKIATYAWVNMVAVEISQPIG